MGQPQANEVETIWLNARLATLAPDSQGLGTLEKGAVASHGGRIAFAGPQAELPAAWRAKARVVDCEGRWITPGLVDCHTHLVYGGDRAEEFEMRLAGASYEEIAKAGGGILSTVRATRAANEEDLVSSALRRLDALIADDLDVPDRAACGDVGGRDRRCRPERLNVTRTRWNAGRRRRLRAGAGVDKAKQTGEGEQDGT